jgi:choline dehydrogenase-like flavoprotein
VSAKRVILTCGTLEIVRLMLQPLADGRPPKWADNPWLGCGFIDHIEAVAGHVSVVDKQAFHQTFDNIYIDKIKYLPRLKVGAQRQRGEQIMEVAARFEFRSAYKEDLANLKLFIRSLLNGRRPDNLAQLPAHLKAVWKVAVPLAVRYLKSRRGFNPTDGGIDFMLMSEQWPTQASRLSLSQERDALGMQKLDVKWTIDGRELESMARFAEIARDSFANTGVAQINIDPRLLARDPAFLDDVLDYYHQMGGARISSDAQTGVVDANLRVHGTDNLYVGGAAVYPFSGFGNPTYTAMALGIRLCDHLRKAV